MSGSRISIGLSCLALAACSAPPGTNPADRISGEAPVNQQSEEGGSVRLSGDGIRTTGPAGETLPFSTSRDVVETAVTAALGQPQARGRNEECGAGPVDTTVYLSGLSLNFQGGFLVGWLVRAPTDAARATTPEGIRPGSAIADARRVYSLSAIENSTLGEEYSTDEGIGLFAASDGTIGSLYAGTNCFFR